MICIHLKRVERFLNIIKQCECNWHRLLELQVVNVIAIPGVVYTIIYNATPFLLSCFHHVFFLGKILNSILCLSTQVYKEVLVNI